MALGPISRFPLGMLDLFGVKQNGEYPKQVAEFIQPTFDESGLLYSATADRLRLQFFSFVGAAGAPAGLYGPTVLTQADQNETLIVSQWSLMCEMTGVAASLPPIQLGHINVTNNAFYSWSDSNPFTPLVGVATSKRFSRGGSGPIYIPPGHAVYAMVNDNLTGVAGGTLVVEAALDLLRVRR